MKLSNLKVVKIPIIWFIIIMFFVGVGLTALFESIFKFL